MPSLNEDLDRKRRLARRLMAWISFSFLLGMGTAILAGAAFGNASFADSIEKVSGVLNMILGVFAAIVLGYLGVSVYEATRKP